MRDENPEIDTRRIDINVLAYSSACAIFMVCFNGKIYVSSFIIIIIFVLLVLFTLL